MKLSLITLALAAGFVGAASARTVSITGLNRESGIPASLSVAFGAAEANETNILYMAWDNQDGGTTVANWRFLERIATIPPEQAEGSYALPTQDWPSPAKAIRFFLVDSRNAGYDAELSHIAGTGLSYQKGPALRLDYKPTGKTRIELTAEMSLVSENQCFFCARGNKNFQDRTYTLFAIGTGLRYDYYDKAPSPVAIQNGRHTIVTDYQGLTVDGTRYFAADYGTEQSFTAGGPLVLFASYADGAGTPNGNYGRWKFYSMKAWNDTADESSLALDLIPVKKDGRVGVYDKVSKTVTFANCGTGEFVGGDVVSKPGLDSATASDAYVAPADETATWVGGEGVSLATAAGWKGGACPNLDAGVTRATFTENAAENATVPAGGTCLWGITFSNATATSAFRLKPADETSLLAIGGGGVTAVTHAGTTARWFGLLTPILLTNPQTWTLGTNANISLKAPLSARDSAPLQISSVAASTLEVLATSPNTNAVTVLGNTAAVSQGSGKEFILKLKAPNALGTGPLWVDNMRTAIEFYGDFTNDAPLTTSVENNDWCKSIRFDGNIVFNGSFTTLKTNVKPYFRRGKTVTFNGPVTTASAMYCQVLAGEGTSEVVFNGKLSVGDRFNIQSTQRVTLNARGNRINGNKGSISGTLRCGCPYALGLAGTVFYPNVNGILDLNGFDQQVNCIYPADALKNSGTVTSATPATLYLIDNRTIPNYDSNQKDAAGNKITVVGLTNYCAFAGCASLVKGGPFTNRLVRVSTTCGDLAVTNGLLVFASSATWLNASNVTARAKGRLLIEDRAAADGQPFGKHVDLHVADDATVELANTTPVRVRYVTIDGARADFDCYWGSEAAKAANPDKDVRTARFFTGTGLIRAQGIPGLRVIVR